MIVGAFILCWLPYFTLFMVVAYCGVRGVREGEGENGGGECGVNPTLFTATIWFGYFNSALNPILYPLCNANFKRAFKQVGPWELHYLCLFLFSAKCLPLAEK